MPLLDLMVSMLFFFLFAAWLWVVVMVVSDIFHNEQLSGGVKAAWVFFVILVPWLGVLAYIMSQGDGMIGPRLAV